MKNILFINSSSNNERSRTYRLACRFLSRLPKSWQVTQLDLYGLGLLPADDAFIQRRTKLSAAGDFSSGLFACARQLAEADLVVMAVPFWDLSFPSILKVYFEHVSVCGVTFSVSERGYTGLCRAKACVYIATAGGCYDENLGASYTKALMAMFGVKAFHEVTAYGLDIDGADTEQILTDAQSRLNDVAEELAGGE